MPGFSFPFSLPAIFGDDDPSTSTLPFPSWRQIPHQPIVTDQQYVSIRDAKGTVLWQYTPREIGSMKWSRDQREISKCELSVPSPLMYSDQFDVTPWLHWVDVWDDTGKELLWSGVIQSCPADRKTMNITASDAAIFLSASRSPLTKKWDVTDAGMIASELWDYAIDLHNLPIRPYVRLDLDADPIDFEIQSDTVMLDKKHDDLTQRGLHWTVVGGVPMLGPMPVQPISALAEADFLSDSLRILRDGTGFCNDVLLRGASAISHGRVNRGGLNIQKIITVDDVFSVSNADAAVQEYLLYTSVMRDAIDIPRGVTLNPRAPVSINELLPGCRFVVEAMGLRTLMELDRVEVAVSSGQCQVNVSLESVIDLPELGEIERDASKTLGSQLGDR